MGLSIATPVWLWLALPAIGLTLVLSHAARHHLSRLRRALALGVRLLILSAVILALAGLQVVVPVDRLTTVFVVDLSDSVGDDGRASAFQFVRDSLRVKPAGDRAGIVAFGGEALVERLPAEEAQLERIASVPVRTATDIGAALRLAAAIFPDATQKRIVLVSDGNDTTGRGQSEAALAAARGIQVETRGIGLGEADEAVIERLRTPTTARVGEQIEAEVTVRSTVRQRATVRLFGDGKAIGVQRVTLEAGSNRIVFRTRATEAGFHAFRAVVEAGRDTFSQNNRADSNTIVKGEPRILVVAGDEAVAGNLVAALKAERRHVTRVVPEALPADLPGLATYDSVVLVDTPARRLTPARMRALQVYTRDLGRGLVMVGGPQSYGAGGYARTPLEETLPVEMDVRNRKKDPEVALVVVLDKSGSMAACHCNTVPGDLGGGMGMGGTPKVDIGKEAILRAVAALTERDELGVVAFDENAHWAIHTAPLGQIGDVEDKIAGIRADGQTNLFAGLSEAVESLEKATATRRHVILLSDGWSQSGDYEALLARMKAAGITLSTVGAGSGSSEVLALLARRGGGRHYRAENPSSIPDIFLKETQQVSGQQIVEEPFFPIQTGSSPILRGLERGLPQLLGYNGTTPKAAAQTVLVTARDDPLLAQWQYGLGRSVAWTSDATGRWARNWVAWPGFNRFFSQLVAWTFPGEETRGIEAELLPQGDETRLRLESVEEDGTPRNFYETVVTLVAPDLRATAVRLQQSGPGVYEASLGKIAPGAYALRVIQAKRGATALGRTIGLVAPTPGEYRVFGVNDALLASLRAATGGREVTSGSDVWRHDLRATSVAMDLWPWLLLLALLLWPLDVALRRVSVTRRDLSLARAWARDRLRGRSPVEPAESVGELLAAKERATAGRSRAALLRPIAADPPRQVEGEHTAPADASRPGEPDHAAAADRTRPAAASSAAPSDASPRPAEELPPPPNDVPGGGSSGEPPGPRRDASDTLKRLREAKDRAARR
jgi:uncharacterized membrane protein